MTDRRPVRLALAACGSLLLGLLGGCASSGHAQEAPSTDQTPRNFAFWPQFPDDPHVQFVKSFKTSEDVSPTQATGFEKLVFGKDAPKEQSIDKPYGVAMRDGKIYVCDIRSGCLTILDLKKKQTRLVGVSGTNQLKHPVAVAVADDGMIYVADNERGTVFVFDASERYLQLIGHPNLKPLAVAVHAEKLYVADATSHTVEVFDRMSGKQLGAIGSVGDEDGQFRLPLSVATDAQGDVFAVDMMRCRVQKFGPDGKFISGLGEMGDYAGSFARPKHMAVDSDGIVYVVDAVFQNVQMFDKQNRLLMHFGATGPFPGSMNLPAGVAVCEDAESLGLVSGLMHPGFKAKRLVVVSNQIGDAKVSLYAMGDLRPGFTAQDLSKGAASIRPGVGVPTAEDLRLQSPTGPDPGAANPAPAGGAQPNPTGGNPERAAPPAGAGTPAPTPVPTPRPASPK